VGVSRVVQSSCVQVTLSPELGSRIQELAATTGRTPDQLIEDAMAAYLRELEGVRSMLDGRYDDIVSGRVTPIDGREFFEGLRRCEDQLIKQRSAK